MIGFPWRAAALALCGCSIAHAATFTVTKTSDTADGACDADCSLREAIIAANGTPGADIVRLKHAYYRLTRVPEADDDNAVRGDLDITDALVLRGLPDRTTIDVDSIDRGFEVLPGVTAEIIDVTVREGRVAGRGGCIYNEGRLTLRRTWLTACRVTVFPGGIVDGGGIFNLGELRVVLGKIYKNVALDGETLTPGRGGGIFNGGGAVIYMYDTDVRENVTGLDDAAGQGAGLFNWGAARIEYSFFFRNDPGGGEGSAIANREGATLAVFNTTISGNGHDGATGAIANGSESQGETEPQSKLNLLNVTIANNNGGGLFNTGRVRMTNTIIAGNFVQDVNDRWYDAGKNCENVGGDIAQSHSLVGADGNCPGDISVDNAQVFSLVLEHLAYLGGPTPVHNLRQGPYAIDMGHPTSCPGFDQRRGRRPADGDMNGSEICDIGAMEVGADE